VGRADAAAFFYLRRIAMNEPFQKGRQKTGGRVKGSRNKLSAVFVEALAKEFEEYGEEALRICRIERPSEFIKIVASIIPKEFEVSDNRLKDLSDDELDFFLAFAKRQLTVGGDADSGEDPTIN
jgi:hypothetical protein